MDSESIHRDWIEIFGGLLKDPGRKIKEISQILSHSRKFIRLFSIRTTSTTYTSYAERVRESIKSILRALVSNIDNTDSHLGIYCIVSICSEMGIEHIEILSKKYQSTRSFYLLKSIEALAYLEIPQPLEEKIIKRSIEIFKSENTNIEEIGLRILYIIYAKDHLKYRNLLLLLTSMFRNRHMDLYTTRIYPEMIKNESLEFSLGLIGIVLRIETFPVLTLLSGAKKEVLLSLTAETLASLRSRLQSTTEQEYLNGLSVFSKIPERIPPDEFISLLQTNHQGHSVLYKQSTYLIEYLEEYKEINTLIEDKADIDKIVDIDKIDKIDKGLKVLTDRSREILEEYLSRLAIQSDGTKIQYCRIVALLKINEEKKRVFQLLKNKNIKVKWNALRALSQMPLDTEDISQIVSLYESTSCEKIKLWALKTIENSLISLRHPLPERNTANQSISLYSEEILETLKRINASFLF
ncbi:hypothetical protein NEOKW01_2081 [Nematocida sp. AWRm80]|nr:hypothetical protein NEOKW01_2081 [Nematocida sp. AWRm80]